MQLKYPVVDVPRALERTAQRALAQSVQRVSETLARLRREGCATLVVFTSDEAAAISSTREGATNLVHMTSDLLERIRNEGWVVEGTMGGCWTFYITTPRGWWGTEDPSALGDDDIPF